MIYGALRADAEHVDIREPVGSQRLERLVNNSSYLGFRAREDLGGGLQAWAQIEGAVGLDDGTGAFAGRNTGVGLTGAAGAVLLGQWDSPYKLSTGFLDPFSGTTDGVYLGVLGGNLATTAGAEAGSRSSFERRVRNTVHWASPAGWGAFEARAAVGLGESDAPKTAALEAASLTWHGKALNAGAAVERHTAWLPGQHDDAVKLYAQWAISQRLAVGLVLERIQWRGNLAGLSVKGRRLPGDAVASNRVRVDAALFAMTYNIGPWHLNLNVGRDDGIQTARGRLGDSRARQLALGLAYSLGPRTELCGIAAQVGNGSNAANSFGSGRLDVAPGARLRAVGAGIVHRF